MRSNSKTKSIWVSLCRFLVYIILIFAVIASGIIVYYSLSRNSFIDLLYLILTFLFPVLLSAIPMSVYIACCRSKLSNRLHETIEIDSFGILYKFSEVQLESLGIVYGDSKFIEDNYDYYYRLYYSCIDSLKFSKDGVLSFYGSIPMKCFRNDKFNHECVAKSIDLINAYDCDLVKLFKTNGLNID